jgi:hypothetical protein
MLSTVKAGSEGTLSGSPAFSFCQRGKLQIVIGLLSDPQGEPLAVRRNPAGNAMM